MSIRIRAVDGITVALCAVESDSMPGDIYLDDAAHYALAAKFCRDWQGSTLDWDYPEIWVAMDTQKVRDAKKELERWHAERQAISAKLDRHRPKLRAIARSRAATPSQETP